MKIKAVLDTNVFVSALLFEGISSQLLPLWKNQTFTYLLSRSILDEYLRVLAYSKFKLSEDEIKYFIEEELLPFVEIIPEKQVKVPSLTDPDDEKFLQLANLGKADYLISGDKILLEVKKYKGCQIINPSEFLRLLDQITQ